jgi:hypothetical protein
MREVPFSGRLDVCVACLLVVERHGSVANRSVTQEELREDLLSLVESLDVPPECLCDLDVFDDEVARALRRMIRVGWIHGRTVGGVSRFAPREVAAPAVAWMRSRFALDGRLLGRFERLDHDVTQRVLADYDHSASSRRAASGM